jgi:hypothetical protein
MRKFIVWQTSKSEYGTGSWAIIDGLVMVTRSRNEGNADWRLKSRGPRADFDSGACRCPPAHKLGSALPLSESAKPRGRMAEKQIQRRNILDNSLPPGQEVNFWFAPVTQVFHIVHPPPLDFSWFVICVLQPLPPIVAKGVGAGTASTCDVGGQPTNGGGYVKIHQRRYSRRRACRGADVAIGHEHAARCQAGARCSTAINAFHSDRTSARRGRDFP